MGGARAAPPGRLGVLSLRLRTEQPDELAEVARVLGPMNVGRVGGQLAVTVRRAGGAAGPEAARRLFGRLDEARIWCLLEQEGERPRTGRGGARRGTTGRRRWQRLGARRSPSCRSAGATCSASSRSSRARCYPAPPFSALRSTRRVIATPSASRFAAPAGRATACRRRWRGAASSASTTRGSRAVSRCCGSFPIRTTSPRKAPSGMSAARCCKGAQSCRPCAFAHRGRGTPLPRHPDGRVHRRPVRGRTARRAFPCGAPPSTLRADEADARRLRGACATDSSVMGGRAVAGTTIV